MLYEVITAANSALISIGFDDINIDVVGMVVVVYTESAPHDSVFCNFAVKKYFNDNIERQTRIFKCIIEFYRLILISWESVKKPAVLTIILRITSYNVCYTKLLRFFG